MEAGELGLYMFFAVRICDLTTSILLRRSDTLFPANSRRMLYGFAMGATVIAIVMSPWGKAVGLIFNPAQLSLFIGWKSESWMRCSQPTETLRH